VHSAIGVVRPLFDLLQGKLLSLKTTCSAPAADIHALPISNDFAPFTHLDTYSLGATKPFKKPTPERARNHTTLIV
jgi:hypothetical protein